MVRRLSAAMMLVLASTPSVRSADEKDPLARARMLYNERRYDDAIAAAEQAAAVARADSADLIAARAYLERFRQTEADADLASARERLRRIDPHRLGARERIEFLVGLGEALFFEHNAEDPKDRHYGAAAELFNSILPSMLSSQNGFPAEAREQVLDWWASALDYEARTRPDIERQGIYQRIRDRMHEEIAQRPDSTAAAYWLSAAARGQGDLLSAWDAAEAGWVRADLASDRGVTLRAELDQLMREVIVPERAKVTGVPPETFESQWALFKAQWTK